ncbi:head GIN domain-containing protein [Sphingobacterium rhinopitheci]|uniref:head GIN domain-containing protein n=1 Tax=Sphingobacterium rhinopitheci TaxID=2781960 RepID=UPI001F51EB24|nr:head GIN domain-containing protein [Sphingobacterium rhinopitheci]MCI0919751.1 DUF2807 domain-containing protein [Sphingobacterium rhinopitheci]
MKKIYAIALFLLATTTIAFGQLSRELNAFRELEVTDKINVKIVESTTDKIVIEGELANQMELTQVNDMLRLTMTGSYIMKGDKVFVTLYSSRLASITAKKGAQVTNPKLELKGDSLYLSAIEGGNIDLTVNTKDLKALVTTGGSIMLQGNAVSQDVNVALGGSYFGRYLLSNTAIARVSGGGKIQINATKSVDVQTRAGGIVDIYGNPKDKKEKKLVGGKINYL